MLGTFALLSLTAYFAWLLRLRQRGGRVQTSHIHLVDLAITIGFGIFLAVICVSSLVKPEHGPHTPLTVNLMLYEVGLNVCIAFGLWAVLGFREGSVVNFLGLRAKSPLRVIGLALLFLVAAYPGLLLMVVLTKALAHGSDEQMLVTLFRDEARDGHMRGTVMIFLSAALVAPMIEEFVFRGYFYATLKRYVGIGGAALLTSALFALVHVNLASLAALFYLALCLTLAYEWTGSLLVPITMHALFNTASLVALYVGSRSSPG